MTTPGAPQAPSETAALLGQAVSLLQLGQLATAEQFCRRVIELEPRHSDALHVQGIIALSKGDAATGVALIRSSLEINPAQPHVLCSLGNGLRDLGRSEDALTSYGSALQLEPRFAGAAYGAANVLSDLGRLEEAVASYDRALVLWPDFVDAHVNRGNALRRLGRTAEALESYRAALARQPDSILALGNCASLLWELQRLPQALELYDRLAALTPADVDVCLNRGLLLHQLQRHRDAVASFDTALLHKPDAVEGRLGRANALLNLKEYARAIADCDLLLKAHPGLAAAHCTRACCLLELERTAEALEGFNAALRLDPALAQAADGRGIALRRLGRPAEALAACEEARRLAPQSPDILYRYAIALREVDRHAEAAAAFAQVLELSPDYDYARGALLHERALGCDWSTHPQLLAGLEEAVLEGRRACVPGVFLSLSDSARAQQQCARTYVADKHPPAPAVPWVRDPQAERRPLRIAYVSGDFGEHPVSLLLAGVLERHDRARFETIAVSLQPASDGLLGRRVQAAVSQFIDVSGRSDHEVTTLLRELEVDIAVDLMGHTSGSRAGLFTARVAPVQLNFLGYPGTAGAPCWDYILADRHVIPEAQREVYDEKVVYLPHCFQPSEARSAPEQPPLTRAECSLPAAAFVFCCFNASYKITPETFDCWMRILRETPGSVLFLLGESPAVAAHLRAAAAVHGVAAERLVFGGRLPFAEYLARYGAADLFLDTLPYNAGTTASDALWAGLPVLTCAGGAFAARMGASLLHALGLPELVTYNRADYVAAAREIATTPGRAGALRAKLARARLTSPLFDAARYVRDLENAYVAMWDRFRRGEAPQHLAVGAAD